MTGFKSKKTAAQDKLDSMEREALKLAQQVLESLPGFRADIDNELDAIKESLAQPVQNHMEDNLTMVAQPTLQEQLDKAHANCNKAYAEFVKAKAAWEKIGAELEKAKEAWGKSGAKWVKADEEIKRIEKLMEQTK